MSQLPPENYQEWNPPKRSSGFDLAARLMEDMDPDVLEFLKSTVNTFIRWDLVNFFSDNPNTTDTAVNIARYIGRDVKVIESELDELAIAKVLRSDRASGLSVYSLTADPAMRDRIKRFALVAGDVQYRGKVFYHLIRGMR
jgi:hypothetical protein